MPSDDSLDNPQSVKEYFETCICADFNLTQEQAVEFFQSFIAKITEQVETTGTLQLPKGLWLKKDSEGFYLE